MLAAVLAVGTAALVPAGAQAARSDNLATADQLARSGQHAQAAELYESLAKRTFRGWDARVALLAAREYGIAGRLDDAERMIAKVEDKARGDDKVLLARVQAEVALARNRPTAAIDALTSVPTPWPAPLAVELLALRARAEFAAGRTLQGIRTLDERARVLGAADARRENYSLLVDALLANPAAAASVPPDATPSERGWLELAQLLGAPPTDPRVLARRADDWRTRHPHHPGADFLPEAVTSPQPGIAGGSGIPVLPSGSPDTIALLLPLTGRYAPAGTAVRDGFVAAALTQSPERRPRIQIYDTSELGARPAYERALADGAQAVAGPLTKEDVAALVASGALPVPTLALNVAIDEMPPPFLFQFALDPEQEARAVARRIAADGRQHGIALFPRNDWGDRLYSAFTAELMSTGVQLTSAQYYDPAAKDFSGPLRAALGRFGGAGDRDSKGALRPRDAVVEARDGPQFAFIAASPQAAGALKLQLRFQMAYELPLYATSDAWEPSTRSAPDLDGLVYPEMPWILNAGSGAPELWDVLHAEWEARGRGRLRLHAFGYDAFRLLRSLNAAARGVGVSGLTGELTLTPDGRVVREMPWAQIHGGQPGLTGSLLPPLTSPSVP